jgi:hypothetical protein
MGGSYRASIGERYRRTAIQRGVAACRVIALELGKLSFKITTVPEQHVVKKFASHRPDQALDERM